MPAKKYKIRRSLSRARAVLRDIAETFEYIYAATPHRMPPTIVGLSDYRIWKAYKVQKDNQRYMYALKRHKYIEARKIGKRLMVRLTDEGYRQVLRATLRDIKKKCVVGVCLVSFDIPESQKVAREMFRRLLRECGFKKLHHSVWFTEYDVRGPLLAFVRANRLTPWVHIFVGKLATAQ